MLPLNELKDKLEAMEGVQFKQFNSITDYHSLMFDLGIIARRLRSASDRSKFYRLIEASLYGGISSAITRSLRDYLLPENSGVRKAFEDMEAALRENCMTLEAIRVTQSDRDLFKHLISEATNYVAADYMRHANEPPCPSRPKPRSFVASYILRVSNWRLSSTNTSIWRVSWQSTTVPKAIWKRIIRAASDHLNRVQTALRQQERRSNATKRISMSCRSVWKSKNEVVAEAIERRGKRTRLARKLPNWKWTS